MQARPDRGMVVSSNPLASLAGLRILKSGGNAVDAAVGTALALGVVSLAFSGIGGGGFILLYDSKSGKTSVVDYREAAPLQAKSGMFENGDEEENSFGYRAIATPATILGLSLALEKFGTKSFSEVSKEAIKFAREGFAVNEFLSKMMRAESALKKFRAFDSGGIMLHKNGQPLSGGERLALPNLGKVIESASKNPRDYYLSEFSDAISEFVLGKGGILSKQDFEKYQPKLREPLKEKIGEYEIASLPPPSSGGICLIQLLKMVEDIDLGKHNSAKTILEIASCFGKIYHGRKKTIADPDFASVDSKKLISDSYVRNLENQPSQVQTNPDSQTTHLSVIDESGNAVALTESLECFFGSGVFVPSMDLFLNDTMHDFDVNPKSINCVEPLKRPRSSMSGTILFKGQNPTLIVGAAGGSRIISSTFEVILNVTKFGMGITDAVRAPRIHFEGGRDLYLEEGVDESVKPELRSSGYSVDEKKPVSFFGGVNAILISDGKVSGGAEPRRNGLTAST